VSPKINYCIFGRSKFSCCIFALRAEHLLAAVALLLLLLLLLSHSLLQVTQQHLG
jgi:hypothetical protein